MLSWLLFFYNLKRPKRPLGGLEPTKRPISMPLQLSRPRGAAPTPAEREATFDDKFYAESDDDDDDDEEDEPAINGTLRHLSFSINYNNDLNFQPLFIDKNEL